MNWSKVDEGRAASETMGAGLELKMHELLVRTGQCKKHAHGCRLTISRESVKLMKDAAAGGTARKIPQRFRRQLCKSRRRIQGPRSLCA
jgi:hypothetical protein